MNTNPRNQRIVQGTGIGFFLSSLLFVFTWTPLAFLLIPAGAAAGFALSRVNFSAARGTARSAHPRLGWLAPERHIAHPNLLVRSLCLLALGAILFLLTWVIGYDLLPEGALRSAAAGGVNQAFGLAETSNSVSEEFWKIFSHNLLPLGLLVFGNYMMRQNGLPLGYVVPVYNTALYGLFVGTNSFAIPYPERLAPTLEILGRAGPYEMAAFCLAAAATATWSIFEVRRLFRTVPEKRLHLRITPAQVIVLLLAVTILAFAAWREAAMIMASAG